MTAPYDEGGPAGRLLAYCHPCRQEHSNVAASIPLELVGEDLFVGLYAGGFTRSDPDLATSILFGTEMPSLAERARRAIPLN